jgi:hypothetical protein
MAKHFADVAMQLAPLLGRPLLRSGPLHFLMSRPSTNGIQVSFSKILKRKLNAVQLAMSAMGQ